MPLRGVRSRCDAPSLVLAATCPDSRPFVSFFVTVDRLLLSSKHPTGKIREKGNSYPCNIGSAVATRDLLDDLRGAGEITGGPPPLHKRDRSRLLQRLDEVIQAVRRKHGLDSD